MKAKTCAALIALCLVPLVPKAQTVQPWMSPDVKGAWNQGYQGQGTTITVIDDFTSQKTLRGNFGGTMKQQRHGEHTRQEASLIAPRAAIRSHDYNNANAVGLSGGLNVMNMSYGVYLKDGYANSQIGWTARDGSLISHARNGAAVIAKAAGNHSTSVSGANSSGQVDYLNRALVGAQSAIFVGALDKNGAPNAKASMASYSNYAGSDPAVQRNFLVVGVDTKKTNLYGTSFAAPVVSGYAAILGSKFKGASATQITNQLLNTARTDTVASYNPAVHGRGEASLSRALAPVSIR